MSRAADSTITDRHTADAQFMATRRLGRCHRASFSGDEIVLCT
jgi:hypothetical protein